MAGELPKELLAEALTLAARVQATEHVPSMAWHGLRTLTRCAATSKHWRAAAELAAARLELDLVDDDAPPDTLLASPGLLSWARRCLGLDLRLNSTISGTLSTSTELRPFLVRCDGQPTICATVQGTPESLSTAQCESALAACGSMREYCTDGYLPAQHAPRVETVRISPEVVVCPEALQLCLVRLQACQHLTELHLDLRGTEGPHVALNAAELSRLQLPTLRRLVLQFDLSVVEELDLSWLGLPQRSFKLTLVFWDEGDSEDRLEYLQQLPAVLRATDELHLFAGTLSEAEQHCLGQLRLAVATFWLSAQDIVQLPQAPDLTVRFKWQDGQSPEITWAALTRCPSEVHVYTGGAELQVLGCDSETAPAFGGGEGWLLAIFARGTPPHGLPAMSVRGGALVLFNEAAADWCVVGFEGSH